MKLICLRNILDNPQVKGRKYQGPEIGEECTAVGAQEKDGWLYYSLLGYPDTTWYLSTYFGFVSEIDEKEFIRNYNNQTA